MAELPRTIEPMRALTGDVPAEGAWAFEVKWDGIRAIVFVEAGTVRVQSSNLLDITARWPELAALGDELAGKDAVLDGEIVTFNAEGRPDFGLLQKRMHVDEHQAEEWAARQPAVLVIFDLLWLDGHDATGLPYEQRRRLLEDLIEPGPNWQVPSYYLGDGRELLAAVTDKGMEGLVAKRLDSRYEPGRRSGGWRKLKVRPRQELVVGGWTPGEGGRRGTLGALIVGYYTKDGRLVCAGRVGSGFSQEDLARWQADLESIGIDASPFDPPPPASANKGARWVEPRYVVEVAFSNWSLDGQLRHPSYVGRRFDKDPRAVVREGMGDA